MCTESSVSKRCCPYKMLLTNSRMVRRIKTSYGNTHKTFEWKFKLFFQPEFSSKHQQIEPRTLYPTHMLTNLRTHICKSIFDFFDNEPLICVSEKDKDLLPRPMITKILDQQSTKIAK